MHAIKKSNIPPFVVSNQRPLAQHLHTFTPRPTHTTCSHSISVAISTRTSQNLSHDFIYNYRKAGITAVQQECAEPMGPNIQRESQDHPKNVLLLQ